MVANLRVLRVGEVGRDLAGGAMSKGDLDGAVLPRDVGDEVATLEILGSLLDGDDAGENVESEGREDGEDGGETHCVDVELVMGQWRVVKGREKLRSCVVGGRKGREKLDLVVFI